MQDMMVEDYIRDEWAWWSFRLDQSGTRFLDENMNLTMEYYHLKNAYVEGFKQGEIIMDNLKNLTMLDKARNAWIKWAEDNNIAITNTQPETYRLMSEAFVDGYLKGFTKRLTEGA